MSDNKQPIDKEYLIASLKSFDKEILSKKYTKDIAYEPKIGNVIVVDKLEDTNVKAIIDEENKNVVFDFAIPRGRSIMGMNKDENDNIVVSFSDDTIQNVGKLTVDIQGDFLTSDGIGNLRYYNGRFQYFNAGLSEWIDIVTTSDNVLVVNMVPKSMQFIFAVYDRELGHYKLKWREPDDTIVDGELVCAVEKVIIRRKLNEIPQSKSDGDLVRVIERSDFGKWENRWYIDVDLVPSSMDIYYYKAFPVSTTGFCNSSSSNETSGILAKDYYSYGFVLNQNESDPNSMITYIEENTNFKPAYMNYETDAIDYGDWKDVWFIKELKPCMLNYDGTVAYELDPNNYNQKKDGTESDIANNDFPGNAMIGIPKVYWKVVDNGNDTANIYFSDTKLDDNYNCWSHIDNNGNEIDYCYMPIYNGTLVDNKLRSLSGKVPINTKDTVSEINYAKSNNLTEDTIWYTEVYSDRMLINLLLLLIGKSTDTQAIFGNGHYDDGTSAISLIQSGTMDTKGMFYGTNGKKKGVKVFGMENFWGNQMRRIAGWINNKGEQKVKLTYGRSDGSTTDGYNLDGSGYISIADSRPTGTNGGYTNKMLLTKNGIIPKSSNGSATTYYTDGLYFSSSCVGYALVGGDCRSRLRVGALCFRSDTPINDSVWSIGASISCKPFAMTGGES